MSYPFVPIFDAHGGHAWVEVFDLADGVSRLAAYVCQRCGESAAAYVVICRPGEESGFTARYGAANVQASPHVSLNPGEAFEIDGRIAHMSTCLGG